MKDKNINTILVLIIILLCYMYFTKKNCKKEIEGYENDTILRRQTFTLMIMGVMKMEKKKVKK